MGSSPEIYRLDLEQGTFMSPIPAHCPELTKVVLAPVHQMLAVGNIRGEVECYDSRSRDCLQCVKIFDSETRDVRFRDDGMQMAVGSETGVVKLFDVRSSRPLLQFEHAYETPITSLKFSGDYLLSSDRKTLRITNLQVRLEAVCDVDARGALHAGAGRADQPHERRAAERAGLRGGGAAEDPLVLHPRVGPRAEVVLVPRQSDRRARGAGRRRLRRLQIRGAEERM